MGAPPALAGPRQAHTRPFQPLISSAGLHTVAVAHASFSQSFFEHGWQSVRQPDRDIGCAERAAEVVAVIACTTYALPTAWIACARGAVVVS